MGRKRVVGHEILTEKIRIATLFLDWTHSATDYLLHLQVHQVRLCTQDQLASHFCWHIQRAPCGKTELTSLSYAVAWVV